MGGHAWIRRPVTLTLLPLPPYSPELNPIENLRRNRTPHPPQRPRLRMATKRLFAPPAAMPGNVFLLS